MYRVLLIIICLLFSTSLALDVSGESGKVGFIKKYPGLKIDFEGDAYKKLKKMYNSDNELFNYEKSDISPIEPENILKGLQENFEAMKNMVEKNGDKIPDCLQQAFNRLFKDIKNSPKPGENPITLTWGVGDELQRKGYNRSYHDIHFQDSLKRIEGNLLINSNGGAKVPEYAHGLIFNKNYNRYQTSMGKDILNKYKIEIDSFFKSKFFAEAEWKGEKYNEMISSPAALFHEFTHLVQKRYPDLFKQYNRETSRWLNEISTEQFTEDLFGKEGTADWFRKYEFKDKATAERMRMLCEIICKDKSKCKKKETKPPPPGRSQASRGFSGEGFQPEETPDDNFSFSSGVDRIYNIASESLILTRGEWLDAVALLGGLTFDGDSSAEVLLKVSPVMVIPTGALMELEKDSKFKHILEQYVKIGGTIVVLTQQYGSHIENLVPFPAGEPLKFYGWREDQSCYRESVYFESMHPVLSSSTSSLVNAAIDGYFAQWPSSASVLLNRTKNGEAAIITYPYGEGNVILTSQYTDWGAAHSQASSAEIKIFRDLVTFARNPRLPIPMYSLELHANPEISLNITVSNPAADESETSDIASFVKLYAYSPDRDLLFYESQHAVSLQPGQETQLNINFTLPPVTPQHYGICNVYYELYDSSNQLIRMKMPTDSGRFSIYKVTRTYTPKQKYSAWVTTKKDKYAWNELADLELHIKNYSDEAITLDWYYDWTHQGHYPLPAFTVPANSKRSFPVKLDLPRRERTKEVVEMFWLYHRIDQAQPFQHTFKGLTVSYPRTYNSKITATPATLQKGTPIRYTITTTNPQSQTMQPVRLNVLIEKRLWPAYTYQPMGQLYNSTQTLEADATFTHSGDYTPTQALTPGLYRLRFDITRPDNTVETAVTFLSIIRSIVDVNIKGLPSTQSPDYTLRYLRVNETYDFKVELHNRSTYWGNGANVNNGKCTLIVTTDQGHEAYRYQVIGIAMLKNKTHSVSRNFTFKPPVTGQYYLQCIYEDETGTVIQTRGHSLYTFQNRLQLTANPYKKNYLLGETMDIDAIVTGSGTFKLTLTCEPEGFLEERIISVGESENFINTQRFSIPTTFANRNTRYNRVSAQLMHTDPTCTGGSGVCVTSDKLWLHRTGIVINNLDGQFSQPQATQGQPLDFSLNISGLTGIFAPLAGQLEVTAPGFGMTDSKAVTLSPSGDNPFTYTIPVPLETASGNYYVSVKFKVQGVTLVSRSFPIRIPAPGILIIEPSSQVNAGQSITQQVENNGGKDGTYEIYARVTDDQGKQIVDATQTLPIAPGARQQNILQLPQYMRTGNYLLYQTVKELGSGLEQSRYTSLQVTGLQMQMEARTQKEKYLPTETVSGQIDITGGTVDVSGTLSTRIIQYLKAGGVSMTQPGEFAQYNKISGGAGYNGHLYLFVANKLIDYTISSNTTTVLLELPINQGTEGRFHTLYFGSTGIKWLATNQGLYRSLSETWTPITTEQGLLSNDVRDVVEYQYPDGKTSLMVATTSGLSELKEGTWHSHTANDLPSTRILKLAVDTSGALWVSTDNGVVKYDGTAFISPSAPFGNENILYKLCSVNGTLWMATASTLYRYHNNTWDQWLQDDIAPGLYISEIKTDDGDVWFRGNGLLVRYEGQFSVYDHNHDPRIQHLGSIIPLASAVGLYFAADPHDSFGLLSHRTGTWDYTFIKKDIDRFLGSPTCLTQDSAGKLYVGTPYGISVLENQTWQNILSLSDGRAIGQVYSIHAAPGNTVFSLCDLGIIKISGPIVTLLPPAPDLFGLYQSIGLDTQSRLWASYSTYEPSAVAYYNNQWHEYGQGLYDQIVSDRAGGVWMTNGSSLQHIDMSLNSQVYNSANSTLPDESIHNLYVDSNRTLWTIMNNSSGQNTILSFNGSHFQDIGNLAGYPGAVTAITQHSNGDLLLLSSSYTSSGGGEPGGEPGAEPQPGGPYALPSPQEGEGGEEGGGEGDGGSTNSSAVYRFDSNSFTLLQDGFHISGSSTAQSFENLDGILYLIGDLGDNHNVNLLQIGGSGTGSSQQTAWSQDTPVTLAAGSSLSHPLQLEDSLPAGEYLLESSLISTSGQPLTQSKYAFQVRSSDLSLTLSGQPQAIIKSGQDQSLILDVYNNTQQTQSGLLLSAASISPSGNRTQLINQTLSLAPGESQTQNLQLQESEAGDWKLEMILSREGTTLAGTERDFQVTAPRVDMEVLYPTAVAGEAFDLKVKLVNSGPVPAILDWSIVPQSPPSSPPLAQGTGLLIQPGETVIVKAVDTIDAHQNYRIHIEGDIQNQQTVTVQYGIQESFNLDVQPQYNEGTVSIGYSLANSGQLSFSSQLQFQLFLLGSSTPLQTITRTYNLYPSQPPITETLTFPLTPGQYILKTQSIAGSPVLAGPAPQALAAGGIETPFTVNPTGIGTVTSSMADVYPVGPGLLTLLVANQDSAAGTIPVTLSLKRGEMLLKTFERDLYLQLGQQEPVELEVQLSQPGDYSLTVSGVKLSNSLPVVIPFRALPLQDIDSDIAIGTPEQGGIPVTLTLDNRGFQDFSGTLVIHAAGRSIEENISVASQTHMTPTYTFDIASVTAGEHQVSAILYDSSGQSLVEKGTPLAVNPAHIVLTQVPQDIEVTAGTFKTVSLTLANQGQFKGQATLTLTLFDTFTQQRDIVLEAGQEITLDDIQIDAALDLPSGTYPFNYSLSGPAVPGGFQAGLFNFTVKGVTIDVTAATDLSLYNVGETAQLTLSITPSQSDAGISASLEAVVNWGDFHQRRAFDISSGSSSLTFDIPLDQQRDEKIFYGIYYNDGKGIHLNDIYLYFKGPLNVETDRQVYNPGDVVHATFSSGQPGTLSVQAFDERHTLVLTSSASASFQVPANTLGGTHSINWNFVPSDSANGSTSLGGNHRFDISGLKVKLAKAHLEKGSYAPGETITAHYLLESNQDITLELHSWVIAPSGEWQHFGSTPVTLSSQSFTNASSAHPFTTTESGTHEWVYALYNDDLLVLNGRLAYNVGHAAVMDIRANRFSYSNGTEPVTVTVTHFGSGSGQLDLYLDEEKIQTRTISLTGTGHTNFTLDSAAISGGSHTLKAILTQQGLTSTKQSSFVYGTHLPDLNLQLLETQVQQVSYNYIISITNSGKQAAAASSLLFSVDPDETGSAVETQTISIPTLQPGTSHQLTITWDGKGKAGEHQLQFTLDPANTVKEYSESNNTLSIEQDVPLLFYTLEVEPVIWSANQELSFITRLSNNQPDSTTLTLSLTLDNDETGQIIFQRSKPETLNGFAARTISDSFNTALFPAGSYTLNQTISADNIDLSQTIPVVIRQTRAIKASLEIQPATIPAGSDTQLALAMNIENNGNVPLEDETILLQVYHNESAETVKSAEFTFSLPQAGAAQVLEENLLLNLIEGSYEVRLSYNEELITSAPLLVSGGIKSEKTVALYPRVLLMSMTPPSTHHTHLNKKHHKKDKKDRKDKKDKDKKKIHDNKHLEYLSALLQSASISYHTGQGVLDSSFKLYSGYSNISILFGKQQSRHLSHHLRERVWNGEGLIWFVGKPHNSRQWSDFTGVSIRPAHHHGHDKTIHILPSPLSDAQQLVLNRANKYRLQVKSPDVSIIAQTAVKKDPVITLRKYGRGEVLVIALPPDFQQGISAFSQLLINAIAQFNHDIYTLSPLTRLLPLEISLQNETSSDKEVTVKEILPYGVQSFFPYPAPLDKNDLQWKLTIPANSQTFLHYWLQLPDQVDSYDIKSEIHDGDTKQEDLLLSLDVSHTVQGHIDELITTLEALETTGRDSGLIRKAIRKLRQVRNRSGEALMQHIRNLFDTLSAATHLSRVKAVDITLQRTQTGHIIRIMSRRIYQKLASWGSRGLAPFNRMLQQE